MILVEKKNWSIVSGDEGTTADDTTNEEFIIRSQNVMWTIGMTMNDVLTGSAVDREDPNYKYGRASRLTRIEQELAP